MEIADVRKRMQETMEQARRRAADRRAAADRAGRAYETFLSGTAVPLFRQVANVLKANSYGFGVTTPAGSVRLSSEKAAEDFIELSLDTADVPRVMVRISRSRGRRVVDEERQVGSGDPASISEEELFALLLNALVPFVER
jgi:hypothetical protein